MRARKSIFGIIAALVVSLAVVWYSGVIEGYERVYEIRPEIRLPEHRTDAARAIDAYERLMERYMMLSERSFDGINVNLNSVAKKLDSIDGKLTALSARMARIEKALGIEPPKVPVLKKGEQKEEKAPLKSGGEMPEEVGKAKGGDSYSL